MAKSHTAKRKKQVKEKRRMRITELPKEEKALTADEQKKVRGGFLALQEATQIKGDALALQEATQMESRKSRQ